MADEIIDVDNIKEGTEAVNEATAALEVGRQAVVDYANAAGLSFDSFLKKAAESTGSVSNSFTAMALTIEPAFNILDKKRDVFGGLAKSGQEAATSLSDSFSTISPTFVKLIKSTTKAGSTAQKLALGTLAVAENMAKVADKARMLEAGLLKTAAATGRLDEFMGMVGDDFRQVSDATATYTTLLETTGRATNKTATEVAGFADQLKAIPGALGKDVDIGGTAMNMLGASMKLAAGIGMEYKDVVSGLKTAYELFNLEGEKSLSYVNRISTASNALKIPLDSVAAFTQTAAEKFKFFGDNTEGALKVLGGFNKSMEGTGLGYKTIGEMATGALEKVKGMNVAQKAFLSQQTGGPGGLQGAFQVTEQLRSGDTAGVMGRVEEALRKQMGGDLVTGKQAAQSQEASAQMMRQIAFLTQGPTAIADTDAQAIAIADAMAKGNLTALENVMASPQEKMADSIERGNEFQESQVSGITRVAQILDNVLMTQSLTLRAQEKLAFGGDSALAVQLRETIAKGQAQAAELKPISGEQGGGGVRTTQDAITSVTNDAKAAMDTTKNLVVGAIDAVRPMLPKELQDLNIKEKIFGKEKVQEKQADFVPSPESPLTDEAQQQMHRSRMETIRLSGLAPPPTMAGVAGAEVARGTAGGAADNEPQKIELTVNLKREDSKELINTMKVMIDRDNDKKRDIEIGEATSLP